MAGLDGVIGPKAPRLLQDRASICVVLGGASDLRSVIERLLHGRSSALFVAQLKLKILNVAVAAIFCDAPNRARTMRPNAIATDSGMMRNTASFERMGVS